MTTPESKRNRRAIARQISQLENRPDEAGEILRQLYPHIGNAYLIGITGAPGTGKSTLVNALAKAYRASTPKDVQGKTIAIISVDPTSPFSGGAILGDRIRLRDLAGDPNIFVRSMATRGNLGGLARATANAVKLFDAAGFDIIIIETVGVGQAEVEIVSLAHSVVVVESPGLGDEVQAIKAGLLEIADIFVVNKADREGVNHTVAALEMMLSLNTMIKGKQLTLRPHERDDLPRYVTWLNDPEVNHHLIQYASLNLDAETDWYEQQRKDPTQLNLAIVLNKSAKHIGNVSLSSINSKDQSAELGILIGEKSHWGQGHGRESIQLLVNFAFTELNLHRIYLRVDASHTAGIKCYTHCGFVQEGRLCDNVYHHGYFEDQFIMSILRSKK